MKKEARQLYERYIDKWQSKCADAHFYCEQCSHRTECRKVHDAICGLLERWEGKK